MKTDQDRFDDRLAALETALAKRNHEADRLRDELAAMRRELDAMESSRNAYRKRALRAEKHRDRAGGELDALRAEREGER